MSLQGAETAPFTGIPAAGKSNARAKSTEAGWQTIEARRRRAQVTYAVLCREAGIFESTFRRIRHAESEAQRRILIRLARALDRLEGRPAPSIEVAVGFYRSAVVIFADRIGADAARALLPPVSASNFDAGNALAGKARRLAFYLAVLAFDDIARASLARAVGYSKQAASKTLKDIEDARGRDPALDALVLAIAKLLTGRDLT